MYQLNLCSPIWNESPSGFDVRTIRFLLLTSLFLLFMTYLIILVILKKTIQNLKSEDSQNVLIQKQTFLKEWQRQYMLCLGDHAIAVGFVICYSPYILEVVLSILYIIIRAIYEFRLQKHRRSLKPLKTVMRVINLTLLLCAMVGLSRTGYDYDRKQCRDSDYRF